MKSNSLVPVGEAALFTAGVLLYIWWLRAVAPSSVAILLAAMLVSFWKHSETAVSLGLGWSATLRALRNWWIVWLVLAPGLLWLGWSRVVGLANHALLYLLWCILQQLTYQKMVADRLRQSLGTSWTTRTISGAAFALVHLPNPVLALTTFVWGTVSSYLFERFPSVFALGILQFSLSSYVFLLAPEAWTHGMRVGPAY